MSIENNIQRKEDALINSFTHEVPSSDPLWEDKDFVLEQIQKDSKAMQFVSPELRRDEDVLIKIVERVIAPTTSVDEIRELSRYLYAGCWDAGPKINEFMRQHNKELDNAGEFFEGSSPI